ncbi:LysR family transcriptional regulator [Kocuria dechangensis]|uniref:LysR family transcriptional regulator n=1 Tax=Kocuria dechangensis TaxID=1176249 RepID=A0A917GTH9_9MICC|nr:LysR substrate-binding domain-containing protein [Kocuria dechangensis]GGG56125.1 LysR family transcriptional regulator [Kocuria dechangensis]
MVEVREARYFIAVAEELHFGRAAERLHMSQPPLSQAIKGLEHRLGVVLLHRSTREVRLTAVGAVFLDQCRMLVGASTAAEAAARHAADGQAGELRIGAVTSAFNDPLPGALSLFRRGHPRVEIQVEEVDTHMAVRMLRRRELDVALVRQLATPPDCRRAILRSEQFVLAVSADWAGTPLAPHDLGSAAELPWIWLPRHISPDYHDQVVASCRAAGFAPEARHTAHSITSQLAMVACGLGVALVPESAAPRPGSPDSRSTHVVALDRTPTIDLAAVWRRDTTPLVDDFLTSVRAAIER